MQRRKSQPIRNKLDLTDKTQVRLLKKRLRLSEAELTKIVDRTGNSIAAIAKEVALQRAKELPVAPADVAPAVIASARLREASVPQPLLQAEPNS
jgi:hypothetical protein